MVKVEADLLESFTQVLELFIKEKEAETLHIKGVPVKGGITDTGTESIYRLRPWREWI